MCEGIWQFLRFNHLSCFEKLQRHHSNSRHSDTRMQKKQLHAVKKFRACTPEERCFAKLNLGDSKKIIWTDKATLNRAKKEYLRRILKENRQHFKRDSTVLQFETEGDNYMSYQYRGHSISFIPFSWQKVKNQCHYSMAKFKIKFKEKEKF